MPQDKVAVIVAHPDDEVLAFGGTMCRHAELGHRVSVLILATGLAARTPDGRAAAHDLEALRQEARAAGKILGAQDMQFADFPDNRMDTVPLLDIIKSVSKFLEAADPAVIYTHHAGDLNIDHSLTARAVLTACRPVPGLRVKKIYSGEVLSSSEYSLAADRFVPNTYVGIAPYLDRKRKALQCYVTEIRAWPHPRSVEAIDAHARLRGSECGMEAAEGLFLLRELI